MADALNRFHGHGAMLLLERAVQKHADAFSCFTCLQLLEKETKKKYIYIYMYIYISQDQEHIILGEVLMCQIIANLEQHVFVSVGV